MCDGMCIPQEYETYCEFIRRFSESYFIGNEKIPNISYVQTNREREKKVLSGSFDDKQAFIWMMAWKMGKIKRDGTLYRGWNDNSNPIMYPGSDREYELKIVELHEKILEEKKDLQIILNKDEPVKFISRILEICEGNDIKGIGPVYAIAILFFFSKGKYPIYDRFARVAVKTIFGNDRHIPRKGESENLPNFDYQVDYPEYINQISIAHKKYYNKESIDYLKNRMVDQALWVYGHGFKPKYFSA
jgi:hypothetical protein